ncbi:MAG: DUF1801 domain-containing protein [Pseudomonadota bacterium]
MTQPFEDPNVERAFQAFPDDVRGGLLAIRDLIFEVAQRTEGVGALQETLKWGQPAYLTPETKSGSTLRLGLPKTGGFAVYAHCQTTIISDFQALFPDDFSYEGNRAVHFSSPEELPLDRLALLIQSALTYHQK